MCCCRIGFLNPNPFPIAGCASVGRTRRFSPSPPINLPVSRSPSRFHLPRPPMASSDPAASSDETLKVERARSSQEEDEERKRKARVEEAWKNMNGGLSVKLPNLLVKKPSSMGSAKTNKAIPDWMVTLGIAPKKSTVRKDEPFHVKPESFQNGKTEEAKRLAAAALSAAKDIVASSSTAGRGKIEITEVRDFAGEDIEIKKLVDAASKEATEKAKTPGNPTSALDNILEQIKKKQKLSVLDKTKKDWSEFKDENKGMEEELDAYKKSSNQYLDKVSFLHRTDHREFERERDARLALQSKRRAEVRDDD